jgi:hypothetical protein
MAHEFWVETEPADPQVGAPVSMALRVGQYFEGERVGVTASHAASIHLSSASADRDLSDRAPADSMLPGLTLTFDRPGAQVLSYESHPSFVTLPAEKFHAYLHDEGLDAIVRQREAAGTDATPGRERFRRSAKALIRVGGQSDATVLKTVGQRIELIPLTDPLAAHAGDRLRFELRFEGRPEAGALVKAWHRLGRQTTMIRVHTDAAGRFELLLPFAGEWMLNAIHMQPATDSPEADWDSFWASLDFHVPAR